MIISMKSLVMNFVQSRGEAKRSEIVEFIKEVKGEPFDPIRDRGYWSTSFVTGIDRIRRDDSHNTYTSKGYFMKPSKMEPRFLIQDKPYGPYRVFSE